MTLIHEEFSEHVGVRKSRKVSTIESALKVLHSEGFEFVTDEDVRLEYWEGNGGRDEFGKPYVVRGGWVWAVRYGDWATVHGYW